MGGRDGRRESDRHKVCAWLGSYHLEVETGLDSKHPRAAWRRERCHLLTTHRAHRVCLHRWTGHPPLISDCGFWLICFSRLPGDKQFASWSLAGFLCKPSSLWSLSVLARGHSSFLLLPRSMCSTKREPESCHREPGSGGDCLVGFRMLWLWMWVALSAWQLLLLKYSFLRLRPSFLPAEVHPLRSSLSEGQLLVKLLRFCFLKMSCLHLSSGIIIYLGIKFQVDGYFLSAL